MADIVSASTTKEDDCLFLPPGFRFHPTDEEIITNYLSEKVADQRFTAVAMGEVDLNSCEPWDLPKKAKMGEKVWYFFCQKDRKYPTGMRTNRATEAGYWKATGKDKEIYKGKGLVGMKKTLVFYKGRAPKGEKTNWVMHEFRLEGDSHYYILPQSTKEEWVVCRVFHKNEGGVKKNLTERLEEPAVSGQQMNISPEFNQILLQNQQNQYFLPQIPPPNPFFARSGADGGLGYLHQGEAMGTTSASSSAFIGQCKVEPVSNSMASRSQETGMSGDWHGEISSNNGNDLSSSLGSFLDLENIWDY